MSFMDVKKYLPFRCVQRFKSNFNDFKKQQQQKFGDKKTTKTKNTRIIHIKTEYYSQNE